MDTAELGKKGEMIALDYLSQEQGLKFVCKNWRAGHKEIDLIFESKDRLHIVEVRSLSCPMGRKPYETVNWTKQRQVISAASAYVARKKVKKELSFDVVSIIFDKFGNKYELEYIPNAYTPRW